MATYADTVQRILNWSNRDEGIFNVDLVQLRAATTNEEKLTHAGQIGDFIKFAADQAYRLLRIPAFECTQEYTVTSQDDVGKNRLSIPQGLTEFIQLRRVDNNSLTGFIPYQAKADIQSFQNEFTYKYDAFFWTRDSNDIVVYPDFGLNDEYQLYYYGRQSEVHIESYINDDDEVVTVDNWLRDENEKILLFGALAEAFDFLAEPEQSNIFRARFVQEIESLNDENTMRTAKGGNIQTHFIAPLI